MFYRYIIYSHNFDRYYKGFSQDPLKRLLQHNNGESRYTQNFTLWWLVYVEVFETKKEALVREKILKKYDKSQIQQLLQSPKNQVSLFL
ncbi:MAG: GIY-YIG nuclease family protein [Bacteroidetes bacterium]|nr:GIY-YIG nuclease family protein [Bacteroidota bacterium]MCB9042255.1 GIY-YIG nuclease family protein [Chitinophagales bacterium]